MICFLSTVFLLGWQEKEQYFRRPVNALLQVGHIFIFFKRLGDLELLTIASQEFEQKQDLEEDTPLGALNIVLLHFGLLHL